ncbi:MAG: hypothetical protein IPM23_00955 [Candidatus Melainabacteria bacterium]|nr:hypothetical protein [Candidatus Melainabacteria bacterium]
MATAREVESAQDCEDVGNQVEEPFIGDPGAIGKCVGKKVPVRNLMGLEYVLSGDQMPAYGSVLEEEIGSGKEQYGHDPDKEEVADIRHGQRPGVLFRG